MIIKQLYIDPLIDMIMSFITSEAAKEAPRRYVGASSIGEKCERKLWYQYHKANEAQPAEAKGILAANDGHRSEALMAEYLRKIPSLELWTHKEDGNQYGFVDLEGKFKGHVDGIIKGIPLAPKALHIWEHKAKNQKYYDKLSDLKNKFDIKQVLQQWDYKYYCQAVINMHYFGIDRHYMTVSLPGMRDFQTLRTDANPQLAEGLIKKAVRVIEADKPLTGISDNPAWFECKFCQFNHICFNKEKYNA